MTTSELKYLIALYELKKENDNVIMAQIASRLKVARSSCKIALDNMLKKELITIEDRKIDFTREGLNNFLEYYTVVKYLAGHFTAHCKTPSDIAFEDAVNTVCMISDTTRKGFYEFLDEMMHKNKVN